MHASAQLVVELHGWYEPVHGTQGKRFWQMMELAVLSSMAGMSTATVVNGVVMLALTKLRIGVANTEPVIESTQFP
jgi:hypothetical protein